MADFELITGPMYAGKTEELIRVARRLGYGGKKVVIFKPKIDDRYSFSDVVSHDGTRLSSIPVESAADIMTYLRKNEDVKTIAIDEIHFFDKYIVNLIQVLLDKEYKIIATGLDKDFRKEPFGPMPELLAIASTVKKLKAICMICGDDATCTQRIIDGKPTPYDSEIVVVGEKDKYEARCDKHHELPGKPNREIF